VPIVGQNSRVYVLGRECQLFIEGELVTGVSDVTVRETVTEIDATGFNHAVVSTAVVQRTYEIGVSILDVAFARRLRNARLQPVNGFLLPSSLRVQLAGGLFNIDDYFTVHDVDGDEPMDGAVVSQFSLKQWGH
jgi:hypothetical protein